MLNITLPFSDLQGVLDPVNLATAQPQSSPQIKNNTHRSPGPGGPFSAFLRPGSSWYSPGGAFRLTLQASDGNLVLEVIDDFEVNIDALGHGPSIDPNRQRWVGVWSPHIQGKGVTEVDFQVDGNLVAYAGSNAVWNTGTFDARPILFVQDDGNLVIYKFGHLPMWATNTSANEAPGRNV
jgi:hypothetical protein